MNTAEKIENTISSDQEQAIASWINYLNDQRLRALMESLNQQDNNLSLALKEIDKRTWQIAEEIVKKNRGGKTGIHGFIAEAAEVGIDNARKNILGNPADNVWLDDNSKFDINRAGQYLQMKFYQSGDGLSLGAIKTYFDTCPDGLRDKVEFLIPKDQYSKLIKYFNMPESQANKLPTSNGEFSYKQWKAVHEFFKENDIPIEKIHPSHLKYGEVQVGSYEATMEREKHSLKRTNQKIKDNLHQKSKPTFHEGAKAAGAGAIAEGGMNFVLAVRRRCSDGKRISDLKEDDWNIIMKETGVGVVKGGVRGASIYALTNYTATPASVASSLVTASFGVAQQAYLYRKGQLTEEQFLSKSEMICLDTSVSALSSFIGQAFIPVPVLGAVIGNTIGTFMYQIAKDNLSEKEQMLVKQYLNDLDSKKKQLNSEYQECIDMLNLNLQKYFELLNMAFAPDYNLAFEGSILLAREVGVPEEMILKNESEIFNYFVN